VIGSLQYITSDMIILFAGNKKKAAPGGTAF